MTAILPQLPDAEVIWFLEEEGLLPKRSLAERWPDLFASPPLPVQPGTIAGHLDDVLPGDDGPIVPVPERWYPGVPLPATWEPEEIPGYVEPGFAPAEPEPARFFDPANMIPPPGKYQIVLLPLDLERVRRKGARGFACFVSIVGGPFAGCDLRVEFLTEGVGGTTSAVQRDLSILGVWQKAHGIARANDELDLMRRIGEAGLRTDTFAVLAHRRWAGGLDFHITDIEVKP